MSRIDFDNDNADPAFLVGDTTAEVARLRTELAHAQQRAAMAHADLAVIRMLMKTLIEQHDREMREATAAIERLEMERDAAAKPPRQRGDIADWIVPLPMPRGMR
jgi:hypothetical protein